MSEKMILNVPMHDQETCVPEKCVVEKVIKLENSDFCSLAAAPYHCDEYVGKYGELMRGNAEENHCILFLNVSSGDGFLLQANGGNGKVFSQYIPRAREMMLAYELTKTERLLHNSLSLRVNDIVNSSKGDTEIAYEDILNSEDVRNMLANIIYDMIKDNPALESAEPMPGRIRVVKKPLVESKLYCPLAACSADLDYETDFCETSTDNLIPHIDRINRYISQFMRDDEKERGIMAGVGLQRLDQLVYSVFPSVEYRNGKMYGVLTVNSYGELDEPDMLNFLGEMREQLACGWGESFELEELRLGGAYYKLSFFVDNDNYFLKPESEVFPEQDMSQTMT